MAKSKHSNNRTTDFDLALALELQQEYNTVGITENAVWPEHKNKENYQPRTLIDQTLEVIDPTPNIYTLFMQFNAQFFSNKLVSVEVKWSARMTSCAGTCSFHPRSRDCVISLSAPLLKLRPRKDLVETLLHEMIHGYLFLTNNNRDRDGHGPEFCKHMNRINKEAGTHITIYHSFHDEVKLYQQHWWRCNGPCQKRHPYFGMVRRAMNRAPGPSDFWWKTHQQNCGGEFIKVKEPEKNKGKSNIPKTAAEKKKPSNSEKKNNDKKLDDFFTKPNVNSKPGTIFKAPASSMAATKPNGSYQSTIVSPNNANNYNPWKNSTSNISKPTSSGLVKLGTATNNVHGWGTGGPSSISGKSPNISKTNAISSSTQPKRVLNFAGTIGGVATGRSNLLDKFSSSPAVPGDRTLKKLGTTIIIDSPPPKKPKIIESKNNDIAVLRLNDSDVQDVCNCPICNMEMPQNVLNDHLDICLVEGNEKQKNATPTAEKRERRFSVIEITSSPDSLESPQESKNMQTSTPKIQTKLNGFVISPKKTATKHVSCPVCNKSFEMELLNVHLDNCLTQSVNNENTTKKHNPLAGSSRMKNSNNFVDLTDVQTANSYVCLVCNARISGDIALNDHLDECVQSIFNDDTIDVDYNNSNKSTSPELSIKNDKFPCPICMTPIPEEKMNGHLDMCLSGEKWD